MTRDSLVLPRGALAGSGTIDWRRTVVEEGGFKDVCFLVNSGGWVFEGVEKRYTLALTVVEKRTGVGVYFSGPFESFAHYLDGRDTPVAATSSEFSSWSSSCSFPLLGDPATAGVFRAMRQHMNLADVLEGRLQPMQGDVNSTAQKDLYDFNVDDPGVDMPVLMGAAIHIHDPAFGKPYAYADQHEVESLLLKRSHRQVSMKRSPLFGLSIATADDLPIRSARLAYRRTVRATDTRTSIPCLVPPNVALTEQAPFFVRRPQGTAKDEAFLLGVMASIPFDWYVRRWVELNLSFSLLNAMPIPELKGPQAQRLINLTGQLGAIDDRYQEWATEVGVPVGRLRTATERSDAMAEGDALVAHLYDLTEDQLHHIFETFHRGWDYTDRWEAVQRHYRSWEAKT